MRHDLAYISPIYRPYLAHISPISPLYLAYISQVHALLMRHDLDGSGLGHSPGTEPLAPKLMLCPYCPALLTRPIDPPY